MRPKLGCLLVCRRLAILLAVLCVGALCHRLFRATTAPREAIGPPPTTLYPAVPLDGATNIKKIEWSPSGAFILIEAVTASYDSSKPGDGLLVVLDPAGKTVVSRLPGMRHAFWGRDDSLWVWAANDWSVYSPPFKSHTLVESGYSGESECAFDSQPWAFAANPNSLAVAEHVDDTDDWNVRIYENGRESFTSRLTPQYANGSQRHPGLTFSPSGRLLAVVFRGWVAYETPGPEELWLIDLSSRSARHIHSGKSRWWQIADCDTQRLAPAWSAAGDAVVYGDGTFGIGELSLPGGRTRTIMRGNSRVSDVALSPSGQWLSFERWPVEDAEEWRHDGCMGVISRDGRAIFCLPEESITWPYMYTAWHPHREALAVLRRNRQQSTHDLLYWDLGMGVPDQLLRRTQ